MFLAVNVGNTHISLGLYQERIFTRTWRLSADPTRTEDELEAAIRQIFRQNQVDQQAIRGCAIASVIPRLAHSLQTALDNMLPATPFIVTHRAALGFKIAYSHPDNVGPDRLANALGGIERYGAPLIIIDSGTATTFDVITEGPTYEGGIIMPGLDMSADALFQKTSLLPRVAIEEPAHVVGHSTQEAILSGLLWGTASAIDGLAERVRREIGVPDCRVVATGGHAKTLARMCVSIETADPDLTLYGLLVAWERNC